MDVRFWLAALSLLLAGSAPAADALRELARQEAEIAALKARLRQLEALVQRQAETLERLQTAGAGVPAGGSPGVAADSPGTAALEEASLKEKVHGWIEEKTGGLQLYGFFDLTARSRHSGGDEHQPDFSLGVFEVDLEYPYGEHFAVSGALDWNGDGGVSVGTALIDYHWFDDRIPPRGRIFQDRAFHLQGGRFDLPFGIDYQYFATPDRVSVTAPISTERIQQGGFNSDGVRFYGTWKTLDFTGYWVKSVYGSGGTSAGGRLALSFGRNPYRLHRRDSPRVLDLGVSALADWNGREDLANVVYGGDLTFNTRYLQLLGEAMYRDGRQLVTDGNGNPLGEDDELAWHLTLIFELEPWLHWPLHPYVRYGRWNPGFDRVVDGDDDTLLHRVHPLSRFTAGLNYTFNDYLALKLEYLTHLGGRTREPGFAHSRGAAQLVVNF